MAPIHKEGSKGEAKNYIPVALISHVIKIFKKFVRKKIIEYLQKNGKPNDSQHGIRSGCTTLSQLLSHFDKILKRLERNDVNIVYLDFCQSFLQVGLRNSFKGTAIIRNKWKVESMDTLFLDRQNTESSGWRCELKCKGSNLWCTTRLTTGSPSIPNNDFGHR